VFPSSTTSGAVPPASAASNFVRWSPHPWYWTSTSTPPCFALNASFVEVTISFHPFSASFCSQITTFVAF
jgi:hypothetical protein